MVVIANLVDVDLQYHHSILRQKTILTMDLVTAEVIPTTTILGSAMAIHLMVVTVALDHLTQKVEIKTSLSSG